MRKLPLLLLAACGRLPHVEPATRPASVAALTTVLVESDCPGFFSSAGTGVVISENKALTAAHVVYCPDIPRVLVYDRQGRASAMDVYDDRALFGDGTDVARLEMVGAYDRFGLHVPPPAIGVPKYGDSLCAFFFDGKVDCGPYLESQGDLGIAGFQNFPGESGTPIYDGDLLVGEIHGSGESADGTEYTTFTIAQASWLEGT